MLMFIATFNNVSVFYHTSAVGRGIRRLMFYVTYNIQSSTTLLLLAGGFKGLMVYATFNIVSVIYHSFAVGRGFRRLMFYDTFNIVSVI
jgi:hypothetical protein